MLEETEARTERGPLGEMRVPAWAWSKAVINVGALTNSVWALITEKGYLTPAGADRLLDVRKMTEGGIP